MFKVCSTKKYESRKNQNDLQFEMEDLLKKQLEYLSGAYMFTLSCQMDTYPEYSHV
jgi:hypothetical protein